ncbi:Ktr system potassium uptake protein A [uncultured Clostridium sp.]|nr:Ktr system potassium uptake protein A [uncultured Clostridium sp.]
MNMKKKKDSSIFGIIGLGRFGTALAITLAEAGKEVIVVDQNEEKVKAMRQYTEYAFVCDNISKEALSEVGIQNCDTVVVCIGSKIDTSILTTLNVVSLGVPRVISKATSQDQGAVLEKIGAEVVYPERDMATRLGKRLISGNFLDFIFLDNDIEIQQVPVSDSLVGKTIREINIRKKYSLNIIAIEHQQDTIIEFAPDYEFLKEDIIVVIGKLQNIRKFERAFS